MNWNPNNLVIEIQQYKSSMISRQWGIGILLITTTLLVASNHTEPLLQQKGKT